MGVVIKEDSLILHKHNSKNTHHYIIQISPTIERFIISCAEKTALRLEDYDLPSDFEKLKKESKTTNSKYDIRFTKLFKALQEKGSIDIQRLGRWVTYLKQSNYHAEMDTIKEL